MIRFRSSAAALCALAALLVACSRPAPADPRMLASWMQSLYGAFRVERVSPPVASRLLVYATAALYSGLASTDATMTPLSRTLNRFPSLPTAAGGKEHDATLVAVAAERVVLDSLLREALPTTRAAMTRLADSLEAARMLGGVREATRIVSLDLGQRIGLAIVEWSRTDGFTATRGRTYAPPVGPGLWANDAPGNTFAQQNLSGASEFVGLDNPANIMKAGTVSDRGLILNRPKRAGLSTLPPVNMSGMSEPYWGEVKPFALDRWNECAIPAPYAFSADSTTEAYRDAMMVYRTRASITPEHRAIALFWADNAGESGTPVGHWISIASQMVSAKQMTAAEAARAMVLTATAMADAFIASWGYKYQYNVLRPRPYIRGTIDSTWEPLIATPPFPEYPSGHSTQSAAAATVLTFALGAIAFDDSTGISIGNPVRRFPSFNAAAEEAGMSRVYGGLHFPLGNVKGRELGQCIGRKVIARFTASSTP